MGIPTKVNHDVRVVDGATIWLPSGIQDSEMVNLDIPLIYAEEEFQKYPIGTRLTMDDMVFKYCHYYAESAGYTREGRANRAVQNTHQPQTATGITDLAIAGTELTCTVADVATNNYENGYIIQQQSVWTQNAKLRIRSNTTTVFTLKDALILAIASADNLFFSKNQYKEVGLTLGEHASRWDRSHVAVSLVMNTYDYYFWGQTWGPCCVQFGDSTYRAGDTGYGSWMTRVVFFDHYGASYPGSEPDDSPLAPYYCGRGNQPVGYCIPDTAGTNDWSILMFLQITPW